MVGAIAQRCKAGCTDGFDLHRLEILSKPISTSITMKDKKVPKIKRYRAGLISCKPTVMKSRAPPSHAGFFGNHLRFCLFINPFSRWNRSLKKASFDHLDWSLVKKEKVNLTFVWLILCMGYFSQQLQSKEPNVINWFHLNHIFRFLCRFQQLLCMPMQLPLGMQIVRCELFQLQQMGRRSIKNHAMIYSCALVC